MSSRVFKARTSHTPGNPQLCALSNTPIQEDDLCFYLVCKGTEARPDYQISVVREEETKVKKGKRTYTNKKKIRETPDGQPFFSVFTGEWESYTKADGKTGKRRVYEWQTEDPVTGARIPVKVWSNMVLVSVAEKLGYSIPMNDKGKYRTTTAFQGDRTRGFEHRNADEAEPAMVTVAKAALDDEAAGRVAPKVEQSKPDPAPAPKALDDEDDLAAAMGMTVEQYRKVLAANS